MAVVNNGKLSKTEGIRHVNGETIKQVGEERYKHLRMMEPDRVKEKDAFEEEILNQIYQKTLVKPGLQGF